MNTPLSALDHPQEEVDIDSDESKINVFADNISEKWETYFKEKINSVFENSKLTTEGYEFIDDESEKVVYDHNAPQQMIEQAISFQAANTNGASENDEFRRLTQIGGGTNSIEESIKAWELGAQINQSKLRSYFSYLFENEVLSGDR